MFNFWADESSDFELINATFSDAHSSIWQRRDGSINSVFVAHTDNIGTPLTIEEKRAGRSIPPFSRTQPYLISAIMGFYSKSYSVNNTFIGYQSDEIFERGVASVGASSFDAPIFFEGSTMIDSDPFVPTPRRQSFHRQQNRGNGGNNRARNNRARRNDKGPNPRRQVSRFGTTDSRGVMIIDFDGSLTGSDGYREVRIGPPIMTRGAAGCEQVDNKFDQDIFLCNQRSRRFGSFGGATVHANGYTYSGGEVESCFFRTGRFTKSRVRRAKNILHEKDLPASFLS